MINLKPFFGFLLSRVCRDLNRVWVWLPFSRTLENFLYKHAFGDNNYLETVKLKFNQTMLVNVRDEVISKRLYIDGVYEKGTTEFLLNNLKKGDVFLDIGANIGYYTLLASKKVGKSGKIIAFEPDPENFEILKENKKLVKNKERIELKKTALSNKVGRAKLYQSENNKGAHSLILKKSQKYTEVRTDTLDNCVKDQKIDWIKMDVEGAEPLIIKGMKNTLKNKRPKIIMEFQPDFWNYDYEEVLKRFLNLGYQIYSINKKTGNILKINLEKLKERKKDFKNIFLE